MAKKRYKRKGPPKRGKMTTRPWVSLTPETAKEMTDISNNWVERSKKGRELFLLELNRVFKDLLNEKAPDIDGYKYAGDLKIGFVKGVKDGDVVAIYFDSVKRAFEKDEKVDSVLIVSSNKKSPKYVSVLEKYGPWPSDLMPIKLEKGEATVIVRRARSDESRMLSSRILSNRVRLESELRSAGAKDIEIEPSNNASGVEVHDDVGYTVLRKEFGFEGKQESHWRPALKALRDEVKVLMEKYMKYIVTGKESVFFLPDYKEISSVVFKSGKWFQDKLV